MSERYFCTLFDSNYLVKGVAMLRSLKANCPHAHVFVLCLDSPTEAILTALRLPDTTCIPLTDLEDDVLRKVKRERGVAEYCWTLSPCLPWHILHTNPHVDLITYVDADLLFYSSVQPLFDEIGGSSVAIIEHRFTPRLQYLEVNGRFCVQWVSFRRNDEGLACLSRWRDQCIEWCYFRLEEGRMGDQKYLDEWPQRYPGLCIVQHIGAGVAPWNYAQYRFEGDGPSGITVNGLPLVFFHFHQFQLLRNGRFDWMPEMYTLECPPPAPIYRVYEAALKATLSMVGAVSPGFSAGFKSAATQAGRRWVQRILPRRLKELLRRIMRY